MDTNAQQMIDFIKKEIIQKPNLPISENTALISSGLVDSFSLITILSKLEEVTQMRIPAGKVQPKDMDTVLLMLKTANRAGKPKTS
jgi:acyl carrier protein